MPLVLLFFVTFLVLNSSFSRVYGAEHGRFPHTERSLPECSLQEAVPDHPRDLPQRLQERRGQLLHRGLPPPFTDYAGEDDREG